MVEEVVVEEVVVAEVVVDGVVVEEVVGRGHRRDRGGDHRGESRET